MLENYPDNIYTYDTEFHSYNNILEPISIGIIQVATGKELYLVSSDFNQGQAYANEFLRNNVLPYIEKEPRYNNKVIWNKLVEFLPKNPIFYGYCSCFDHVVLCNFCGQMCDTRKDIPEFPWYTRDLKYIIETRIEQGLLKKEDILPDPVNAHNALEDAKWNLQVYKMLFPLKNINEKKENDTQKELIYDKKSPELQLKSNNVKNFNYLRHSRDY